MIGDPIVETWASLTSDCLEKDWADFWSWLTRARKPEISARWALSTHESPEIVAPNLTTTRSTLIETLKQQPHLIFQLSSRQFELLVAKLLAYRGFVIQVTRATHDGGKDMLASLDTGVIKFLCLVETKRYQKGRPVGVETVRELYGVMKDHGASHAMIVTTSFFSRYARDFAQRHEHQISLQDHGTLMRWIQEYQH